MAKKGMKCQEVTKTHPKNSQAPVPQIQGRAKHGGVRANPIIAGTQAPSLKVYHTKPVSHEARISQEYRVFDNDLARDNLDNDVPAADLQDQ